MKPNYLSVLVVFLFICFFSLNISAQEDGGPYLPDENTVLLFYDDFEETIINDATFLNWTTENLEGWNYWHIIPSGGFVGSQCMRFEISDTVQNDWLISNSINCSNVDQLAVSFDIYYTGSGPRPRLLYTTEYNGDSSQSDWTELNYSLGPNENEWYSVDESVIENPGEVIYFAFQYQSDQQNVILFLLDNFSVKAILPDKPTILTLNPTGITGDSSTLNAIAVTDGHIGITQRGFYWSQTNASPTADDNVGIIAGTTGEYSLGLTGLTPGSTYYYRAFATNSEGTALGEVKQFTIGDLIPDQEDGGPYLSDENTVLLMHFENNVINSAGVGNNGLIHGSGISYETSLEGHGNCIRIDNSTSDKQSFIEIPFYDELNFTEEFSIELWFKINSWGEQHTEFPRILRKKGDTWDPDYEILLDTEYSYLLSHLNLIEEGEYKSYSDVNTPGIMETGRWYHIAVYFNFEHHFFYLVLRDSEFNEIYSGHEYTFTRPFNSNDKLFIGFGDSDRTYFDGSIDELRISSKYRKYRDDVISTINTSELKETVEPLLKDKWKVYQWPFNAYFPRSSVTGELHKGNSCGMTAIMRLMHYWGHPRFPQGNIDFNDGEYHWQADLDNTEYLFDQMPYIFGSDPTEEEYAATATMVMQIGAVSESLGGLGSGCGPVNILEDHFKFKKELKTLYREEYTKDEWIKIFKNELSNGRPILLSGIEERYENGNVAGHFYICDGYNSDNQFHSDMSIGDTEWWTDIDNFEYGINQAATIFVEPDWYGKTLTLDYPNGDEDIQKQTEIKIRWTSENINNVFLEYSIDAGKNWHTIVENVNASTGVYSWLIPYISSSEYKVRISDQDDLNVYWSSETFNIENIIGAWDEDADGDGLLNGEEDANHNHQVDEGETDPTDSDSDDDGMPDGWEVTYALSPLVDDAGDDTDGDGFKNIIEFKRGTNPQDSSSYPSRSMPWLPLLLE